MQSQFYAYNMTNMSISVKGNMKNSKKKLSDTYKLS